MTKEFTDAGALAQFLAGARAIVGPDYVFDTAQDRSSYSDIFAFDPKLKAPSAAVAPLDTAQVQSLVKLAGRTGVPLWPTSRGKNFGYGGAAPAMKGAVILDLSRMKRIIEINVELGYCVVEPGVSFFDLYDELEKLGKPLWMSVPGNAWGSVAGNALERGAGPQPYGDHGAQICGLEVVLADGELVRTGGGAMAGSAIAHITRNAYGPNWDQMFCQSNFGVVTQLGLWLMPAPEATMTVNLALPEAGDLGKGVAMLKDLRQRGVIDHDPAWVSYVGIASYVAPRSRWYTGEGLLPEDVGAGIRKELGLGWWNAQINFYGFEPVIEAKVKVFLDAIAADYPGTPQVLKWRKGDPFGNSRAGIPGTSDMMMINWLGARGGHLGFSPIMPAKPDLVVEQFKRTRARFEQFGIDYYGAFSVGGRSVININEILYDRDSKPMAIAVGGLFDALISDAAKQGYAEYRTHIEYMDQVADTFDFNGHAMRRLNQRLKDALDPAGILAPGKQGIWPARFRGTE